MLNKKEQAFALQLARETIQAFLENRAPKTEKNIPKKLLEEHGIFVTLKKKGKLRGCIGSLEATQSILEGIQENALNAAFNDPRFVPVNKKELLEIKIEISVLSTSQPLDASSPKELLKKLLPNKHGVILQYGARKATFLPSVWQELPDKEQFLSHLCIKAGLDPTAWQSNQTKIWSYQTQQFEE